jgi:aldehyde:ferredoxin oxidoreductase
MFGNTGKYIRVNLSTQEFTIESIPDTTFENYIGGVGIAAKIVYEETEAETDPLGPDNVLASFTGPFTGTMVPSSSRHHYVARSPQTGVLGESNVGGSLGVQLKKAGFDGIVCTGKAESPVYIWINNGEIEIRDATPIWGKDSFDSADWLKEQTNHRSTAAVIGQAGENLVAFASIPHIGKVVRAAGRTGMGAVMGSKNLKAIVAYGTGDLNIADPEGLKKSVKAAIPHLLEATKDFSKYGTSGGVEKYEYLGNFPIKNWQGSRWEEGAAKISGVRMYETILDKTVGCRACALACGRHIKVEDGPYGPMDTEGPEYETVGTMGGECLIDNLEAIAKANELCNRYGMDTITAGATVAFAMEAFDRGYITTEETDGLEITWGSGDVLVELMHRIANRKNIGDLLSKGSAAAAEELGGSAVEFAVHVKGLEPSAHDPRRFWTQALNYGTAARGACHNQSWSHPYELGLTIPELGLEDSMKSFEMEGLAEYVAKLQDFQTMNDTLIICRFDQVGHGVSLTNVVEWFNLITGQNKTIEDLMKVGERIFNLKRQYNVRLGISRKDDFLPPRFMTHNRKDENLENKLPPIGQMLGEYYEYRGWDEIGVPTQEKLAELNLPTRIEV